MLSLGLTSKLGDGRADLLWLDPLNGDGTVRYNMDYQPENKDNLHGSSFEWGADEKIYLGSTQGANMYYANLGGEDRADMIGSNAEEGTVSFSFISWPRYRVSLLYVPGHCGANSSSWTGRSVVQQLPGGWR